MESSSKYPRLRRALRSAPVLYGVPAGFCITGMATLLLPGASPLIVSLGWTAAFLAVLLPCLKEQWSSRAAAWTLWATSVVMTLGVIINCHYYVHVWGSGDVSRPLLMNLDHWSAWNNALFHLGSDHAVQSLWPAEGYGRFIGLLLGATTIDISVPLMFNMFCILATIALTGAIAARCTSHVDLRPDVAATAIVLMALMGELLSSGAALLKDAPMALATALVAWGALKLRTPARTAWPIAAVAVAIFITCYARPNYLAVFIILIPALSSWRRPAIYLPLALAGLCAVILLCFHAADAATPTDTHFSSSLVEGLDDSDHQPQHAAYYEHFSFYFEAPMWKRLLLLPVALGVQFLIPLPWNCANNLAFGPFVAVGYFGFCRYFTGLLVIYFLARSLWRRSFRLAFRLCTTGALFYAAVALVFGGTVSRYGIPLLCLMVPAAAIVWVRPRAMPHLRAWLAIGSFAIVAALAACYILST